MKGSVTAGAVCDLLLLDIAMVQWLQMIRGWQGQTVAWTSKAKTDAAIRWYLLDQHVGRVPVYENICAFCGSLLYGVLNGPEFGNKWSGAPVTMQGATRNSNGTEINANAQPPFLLRWSPIFLAQHVPDVFVLDADTKRLQLR